MGALALYRKMKDPGREHGSTRKENRVGILFPWQVPTGYQEEVTKPEAGGDGLVEKCLKKETPPRDGRPGGEQRRSLCHDSIQDISGIKYSL